VPIVFESEGLELLETSGIFKDCNENALPFFTSRKTNCIYITNSDQIMLYREIIALRSGNRMKYVDKMRGQKVELFNLLRLAKVKVMKNSLLGISPASEY
jgi:hypothetical protein